MLYGLGADDVMRLRRLLIAFEQGRLLVDQNPQVMPSQAGRQDTYAVRIPTAIPAATINATSGDLEPGSGTCVLVSTDVNDGTPFTVSDVTSDKTFRVLNFHTWNLPTGYHAAIRDPFSGYYLVVYPNPRLYAVTCEAWLAEGQTFNGVTYYPAYVQVYGAGSLDLTTLNSTISSNGWIATYGEGMLSKPSPNFWYRVSGVSGTYGPFVQPDPGHADWISPDGYPAYLLEPYGPWYYDVTPAAFTDYPSKPLYAFGGYYGETAYDWIGTTSVLSGDGFLIFGTVPSGLGSAGADVTPIDVYVSAAFAQTAPAPATATAYKAATGMDGIGNIFIAGWNCTVGGGGDTLTDDGSYW